MITASNRAAAGVYADRSGPLIVAWLRERGLRLPGRRPWCPDGEPVGDAMRGGRGRRRRRGDHHRRHRHLAHRRDARGHPRACSTTRCPGWPTRSAPRAAPKVPTAVLSRGLAGVAGRTLVVNLPGSTGRRARRARRCSTACSTTPWTSSEEATTDERSRGSCAAPPSATSRSTSPSTPRWWSDAAARRGGHLRRRGARPRRRPRGARRWSTAPTPRPRRGRGRGGRRRRRARPWRARDRGEPPDRRPGHRRRRAGVRRGRRPPAGGVRDLRRARRRGQARGCRCGSTRCSPTAPTSGSTRPESVAAARPRVGHRRDAGRSARTCREHVGVASAPRCALQGRQHRLAVRLAILLSVSPRLTV